MNGNELTHQRPGRFGPGVLVAAAFIGPGTVTTCVLAGTGFGYALLWALAVAAVSTIILQDMVARLGLAADMGLGEAMMALSQRRSVKLLLSGIIFVALAVGNSAYEAGNLSGAALGVDAILSGPGSSKLVVVILAAIAAALLWSGSYRNVERVLIFLVALMSAAFIAAAVIVKPDISAFARGFVPTFPSGSVLTIAALIGTTIVPYNLFLHAASVRQKWRSKADIGAARTDAAVAIGIGGFVSICILATAAAAAMTTAVTVTNAADLAVGLEGAFGPAGRYVVGLGLAAAGLTSAITAPLATGYVVQELSGRKNVLKPTALVVIFIGAAIALTGIRPITIIFAAQVANGLLLPIIAIFLLLVMNKKSLLGPHANGIWSNMAGGIVVLLTIFLGARAILRAVGIWP